MVRRLPGCNATDGTAAEAPTCIGQTRTSAAPVFAHLFLLFTGTKWAARGRCNPLNKIDDASSTWLQRDGRDRRRGTYLHRADKDLGGTRFCTHGFDFVRTWRFVGICTSALNRRRCPSSTWLQRDGRDRRRGTYLHRADKDLGGTRFWSHAQERPWVRGAGVSLPARSASLLRASRHLDRNEEAHYGAGCSRLPSRVHGAVAR